MKNVSLILQKKLNRLFGQPNIFLNISVAAMWGKVLSRVREAAGKLVRKVHWKLRRETLVVRARAIGVEVTSGLTRKQKRQRPLAESWRSRTEKRKE